MDSDNNVVIMGVNEDQYPHIILRGAAADLSALKQVDTQASFLSQRGGGEEALLVAAPISCRLSSTSSSNFSDESDNEQKTAEGEVFVTGCQFLFAAKNAEDDWAIGATTIIMHAMTEEPELSVYLQLQDEDSSSAAGGNNTLEVTITPLESDSCQTIFKALCTLVSNHPIQLDNEASAHPNRTDHNPGTPEPH